MSAVALSLPDSIRILDLGCGKGLTLDKLGWKLNARDIVVGVDINRPAIVSARHSFPEREFIFAAGECLPFRDRSFDVVLCNVALPYMDIPATLHEIARVLAPGGRLYLKLHPFHFALSELRAAVPHPLRTLFRAYVLANGIVFHFTATTPLRFGSRVESFQTERGMRCALARAGFTRLAFTHPPGKLVVEAIRSDDWKDHFGNRAA